MEYVYAELIRNGSKKLEEIPYEKMEGTLSLLVMSKDISIEDIPYEFKDSVINKLEMEGYRVQESTL